MTNLKDIKSRIQSIESTKKITRAMKMIAAAKVQKSEAAVKASRPFTAELNTLFEKLFNSMGPDIDKNITVKNPINDYPRLLANRKVNAVGILAITSNKGLAGAYNANVVRKTLEIINHYAALGIKSRLFVVGQKGISLLTKKCKNLNCEIVKTYCEAINNPTSTSVGEITEDIATAFVNEDIDKIEIVTTKYKNMMSYYVENWEILPVKKPEGEQKINPLLEFEPNIEMILQKVVPLYITNVIYQAILEAHASELASRMTAMSAATSSAEKMLNELSIQYNKTRQYAITNEIIEVISGANAQN